jgi:plastocyanin
MQTSQTNRFQRWAPVLGVATLATSIAGHALGAERIVHVGQGGTYYVDEASGTKVSTINVGDTITWVWEGNMSHSVTAGTCSGNGGGGIYGDGGGTCTADTTWQSTGLHPAGFTFSNTFNGVGTFEYFCAMHLGAMTGKVIVQAATATGPCAPEPETLCLNGGRFQVKAEWEKSDGSSGHGTGVKLTGDSGYFWFFDPTNIEVVTKVLNGCALTNSYWVFGAGLTNVAVHLVVTDTQTGAVYTRDNSQGSAFQPVQDTGAFPTSCP